MIYPRFTKVIIDYFMTRKPFISRRNRIHWHYVRDDALFSTIKVVSRHKTTQQYGAILPIELTTTEIRNNKAYQEYYACAMGEAAPKPKASARTKKGDSASSTTPPTLTPTTTAESAPRLGSGTGEGTGSKPGVPDVPSDDSEEELLWKSSDGEDVGSHEEGKESDESNDDSDEGSDNDSDKTVKSGAGKDDEDDDDNDDEEELAKDDEEDKETSKGGDEVRESEGESEQEEEESFDSIPRTPEESEEESNDEEEQDDVGVESIFMTTSSPIVSLETPTPIMTPSTIATITTSGEALIPPPTIPSIILENLPTFNSAFLFEERLRTSHAIAADLSEMELKKILIEKMEGNKSIQRSDEQRKLYKVFVEAYEADKAILDTYGEFTILKRRREDDDQEGPSAGPNRGSKPQ
nr:hypothetical protein [Tanacetum cinerariifolium]